MADKNTIPFTTLLRTTIAISSPALVVLLLLLMFGGLPFAHFMYGYVGTMFLSLILVLPFLSNIAALTRYVNDLALDKRVRAPNLSFLSNVGKLSGALSRLQGSWEHKRQEMESVITEREILVDTLPDILIMTDDNQTIVRTNRAARTIFGQNLAHKPLSEVIDNRKFLNAMQIVIEDLQGQSVEFHLEIPEHKDFQAVIERFPIPSEGGISIVITLTDITQQKHIQRMRADFVANASHEIRTPLASIIGFIETLRGPAKDDEQAREEFLKVMAEQAERMSKLVNDLLSLSKIEMNARAVQKNPVDFAQLIRSEKQNFEWGCQQKNVSIRLKLNDNLPPTCGDDDELAQIVRNLIGNAIKYTASGTEVVVTLKLTSNLPDDHIFRNLNRALLFSVQDHGEGIPKEHIPRLTERFYRVDTARARKVGGTGLGLAIVKHVLGRHHGAMTIESELGKGSIFKVFLPLYDDLAQQGRNVR